VVGQGGVLGIGCLDGWVTGFSLEEKVFLLRLECYEAIRLKDWLANRFTG
jgi:hypothetical protein